jgi:hypothetical protein
VKKCMATAVLGVDGDGSVPVPSDDATAKNCCAVLAADAGTCPLEGEVCFFLCNLNPYPNSTPIP